MPSNFALYTEEQLWREDGRIRAQPLDPDGAQAQIFSGHETFLGKDRLIRCRGAYDGSN